MATQPEVLVEKAAPPSTISERFNFGDADVTFRSNDGIFFSVHKKNLEAHAGGFPPAEFQTRNEIVPLTEDAEILDLLFQSIYPQRMPDVNSLPFDALARLAEAAEKYQVFPLMYICSTRMKTTLPNHALDVLAYAARHDYSDIVGEIAPLMLERPLSEVFSLLPPHQFIGWAKYVEHWQRVRQSACQLPNEGLCYCSRSHNTHTLSAILNNLADFKSLRKFASAFDLTGLPCCDCMRRYVGSWKERVERDVESIPKCADLMK